MDISLVICTHNRCESLRHAFRGLKEMSVPAGLEWEVVLVDNNSTDQTKAAVDEFVREARCHTVYVFEARQGKSFALNTGIAHARGRILAFTDDDACVDRGWLLGVANAFADSNCLGIGGRIVQTFPAGKPSWLESLDRTYPPMNVLAIFDLGDLPLECTTKTPPYGANMAFKREAFQQYGAFRTDLGPRGGGRRRVGGGAEDTEFCRRLIAAGERVMYAPSVIVEHPVEEARATQQYFLRWYFNYGRTSIRQADALGQERTGLAGRLRGVCGSVYRWAMARNKDERLSRKLRLYQHCGELVETWTPCRDAALDLPLSRELH